MFLATSSSSRNFDDAENVDMEIGTSSPKYTQNSTAVTYFVVNSFLSHV